LSAVLTKDQYAKFLQLRKERKDKKDDKDKNGSDD
jgi:hypothetical protein